MEKKKLCIFILLFFTLLILLVSFATKGAHWDNIQNKNSLKDSLDQVYPGMEGVIVMDVFLFVLFLVVTFLACKPSPNVFKVVAIIIIVFLVIRFILSLLFLAGNDNYCKKVIENYNSWTSYQEDMMRRLYGNLDYYKTLKGAWAWEIIMCILLYVFSGAILFLVKGIESAN